VFQEFDDTFDGLDHDTVRPRVTEIVFVGAVFAGRHDLGESVSSLVESAGIPLRVRDPVVSVLGS
jgi:hypothetical protein